MKDILEKISSYNIFNYLLPGVLFAALVTNISSYKIIQNDIVTGAFIYYFLGLVISRIGSLLVEPFLKKTGFLSFARYEDFIVASTHDPKIEVLSEANNMYRTFCSLFLMVAAVVGYDNLSIKYPSLSSLGPYFLLALLLALFLFSYRKQTRYITKRVMIKKT